MLGSIVKIVFSIVDVGLEMFVILSWFSVEMIIGMKISM